jgi:hypothetical protein
VTKDVSADHTASWHVGQRHRHPGHARQWRRQWRCATDAAAGHVLMGDSLSHHLIESLPRHLCSRGFNPRHLVLRRVRFASLIVELHPDEQRAPSPVALGVRYGQRRGVSSSGLFSIASSVEMDERLYTRRVRPTLSLGSRLGLLSPDLEIGPPLNAVKTNIEAPSTLRISLTSFPPASTLTTWTDWTPAAVHRSAPSYYAGLDYTSEATQRMLETAPTLEITRLLHCCIASPCGREWVHRAHMPRCGKARIPLEPKTQEQ